MVVRALLVVTYWLVVFSLHAQYIEIGINVIPSVSYRFPGDNPGNNPRVATIQLAERPIHSFDFGIDIKKEINTRFKIGSGVFYSQKGFGNTNLPGTFDNQNLNPANSIDFVQDYLEVPFFINYKVVDHKKFETYPIFGMINAVILNSNINVAIKSGEISEEDLRMLKKPYLLNNRIYNWGFLLGWGLSLKADEKTAVGIELQSKALLTPLHDTFFAANRYLNSVGVGFRFVRKL